MTGSGGAGGVRLRWGGASDVGQVRQANQDSMLLGSAVFVVADGMGGHAGGEVASRLAVETMQAELEGGGGMHRVLDLVTAVQAANDRVWAHSEHHPDLAGMGTTVVAIGLVEEDGEIRLAIVNVGDSRAYRLSEGHLDQISDDHSLVGELFREGRITADEAQHHPQRNIVTRAVGIERFVDVDEFQVLPRAGDRYLLCSDGLTDEVGEADIADALRSGDEPEQVAQRLVHQANRNGGRDNITVVVVDVLDDGLDPADAGRADARRESVPDADDFSEHLDQDTQSLLAVPDDRAHVRDDAARREEPRQPVVAPDARAGDPTTGSPRAVTARSALFVLVLVALLGAGAFLVERYATDTYHVALDGERVAIFKGRPGGFLLWDPELVETTGIDLDDVPASLVDDLEAGVTQPSRARAQRYVENLEDRIESTRPPATTATSTSTTSTTTTAPAPTTTGVTPG